MLTFADVMFSPVHLVLEFLPHILIALLIAAVALTAVIAIVLAAKKKKARK